MIAIYSFIVSVVAVVIAIVSIFITRKSAVDSIRASEESFRRTTTLQTEIFILGAYKDYMDMSYSEVSKEQKINAKARFLSAIDLYCKYVINGHLDKKLSDDNLHFYEECIKAFKDEIKENIKDYNNIADYTQRYNISLD